MKGKHMPERIAIDFVETKKVNMEGFTLVEGFPGMGLVGTIASKYLVEKLGLEQVGFVDSDSFVPIIRIHDGVPLHPSRIYASKTRKLCIIISEQVVPKQYAHRVAESLVDWVKYKGITRIISLTGIGSSGTAAGTEKTVKLYGMASNTASKKALDKYKVEVIKEGITTGVTALILLLLKEDPKVEAYSILGSIKSNVDYKAAAEVLKKLNEVLSLKLDIAPLMKEAKETEKQVLEQLKKLRQTHETVKKIEDQTPMYT